MTIIFRIGNKTLDCNIERIFMKLKTINNILRKIGIVLVIQIDDKNIIPIELYFQRTKTYNVNCKL